MPLPHLKPNTSKHKLISPSKGDGKPWVRHVHTLQEIWGLIQLLDDTFQILQPIYRVLVNSFITYISKNVFLLCHFYFINLAQVWSVMYQ